LGASHQGSWSDFDLLPFLDGKARRVESGTFPLAHGVPARVVRLCGYGNAIVPQAASAFIEAFDQA
jgi:DNA (cytosine-5)-methyltransferase 1